MKPKLIRILIAILCGGLVLALIPALVNNLRLVRYLSPENPSSALPFDPAEVGCGETWLKTMTLLRSGGQPDQPAWQTVVPCGSDYLPLLQAVQPDNAPLAEYAAKIYPNNAQVWLWLGDIYFHSSPSTALQDFQKGVDLNPTGGVGWCRLGNSMDYNKQTQKAADAFMTCCQLDDPGGKGCYGAGRIYEKLGDLASAVAAYRLSKLPSSLQRANELEKRINP